MSARNADAPNSERHLAFVDERRRAWSTGRADWHSPEREASWTYERSRGHGQCLRLPAAVCGAGNGNGSLDQNLTSSNVERHRLQPLRHPDARGDRIRDSRIAAREVDRDRSGTRLALELGRGGDWFRSDDRSSIQLDRRIPIRRTESLRVRTVPPKVAVIVPLWSDVTGVVLMGNVIVVEPAGTVTLAGVVADGSVSLMEITRPPAGAGLASCSLPVTDWHPATIDLLRLNVGAEGSLSSIRTISSRVRMVTPPVGLLSRIRKNSELSTAASSKISTLMCLGRASPSAQVTVPDVRRNPLLPSPNPWPNLPESLCNPR